MDDNMAHHPIRDEEGREEVSLGPLGRPATVVLDAYVERRREKFREKIALPLTYAVIGVSSAPIIVVAIWPDHLAAVKEIATLIIPAITAVYGAIIGFYFGRAKG